MNNITVVLNSSNYITSRSLFSYKLPIPQTFSNKKVALISCSLYKQFENINASYGNNSFTINWIDGTSHTYIIDNGNYTIQQINEYIQHSMYQDNLYVLNSASNSLLVSFLELVVNSTAYGCQLNFYAVPISSVATTKNYVQPTGATWAYPTTAKTPTITFNSGFGALIGFGAGTYGAGNVDISKNSTATPNIAIVNNLLIRTNLINNQYTNPSDILGCMDISGAYGDLMTKQMGQLLYSNISSNNFSEIIVYFSDQNYNLLAIKDTQVCIQLSIVDQ